MTQGHGLSDTAQVLSDGMNAALDAWAQHHGGESELLYWILRTKAAQIRSASGDVELAKVPEELREDVTQKHNAAEAYWGDVRYSSLSPITMLWGTIVNAVRVAAQSDRATEGQKKVFVFSLDSLVSFFLAARERMEWADQLFHSFKAMPAPECQAMAALLNVHVDAQIDGPTLCRLVRLLDHEGRMTDGEREDLTALSNTQLVHAAFSGIRRNT